MTATLHTDGACLGNPGPMGLGIVLELEDGKILERSIPFGEGTNNVAEYSALLEGLKLAVENGVEELEAFADSKLVVEQVNGNWRINDANLQQLHREVSQVKEEFVQFTISHIPREQNARADMLSKAAAERVE